MGNIHSHPLSDLLDTRKNDVERYLRLGKAKWENLSKKIRLQEISQSPVFKDEQIWTFLVACGYALSGEAGLQELSNILTDSDLPLPHKPKVWLEALPMPPRQKEGNTRVDLALGMISPRPLTKSGIQLDIIENTWICFCEMKYDSDLSSKTTHEINRNQLLRVIENALCFQHSEKLADKVYVTLVTRRKYQGSTVYKKYGDLFEDYRNNPASIQRDLDKLCLSKREQANWHYPNDISERIQKLRLKWISYEDLFSQMPKPSDFGLYQVTQKINYFWEYNGLSLEDWGQGLLDAEIKGGCVVSPQLLMQILRDNYQDTEKIELLLPYILKFAFQNNECLKYVKDVAGKYPDLIPAIVTCATNLRKDKSVREWTKYESNEYRNFIVRLEDGLTKKRKHQALGESRKIKRTGS